MDRQRDPQDETQADIRRDAARTPEDPVTRREELELDLMEHGESEAGEAIGEPLE